jgi:hypothetical protein
MLAKLGCVSTSLVLPGVTTAIADSTGTLTTVVFPKVNAVAGEIMLFALASDGVGNTPIPSASSGWSPILSVLATSGGTRLQVWLRFADGGANDIITLTSGGCRYAGVIMRISTHNVSLVTDIKVASATGASGSIDPPALSPGSTRRWLWLAIGTYDVTASSTFTAFPPGYAGPVRIWQFNNANGAGIGVGQKVTTAASEDPGVFTHSPTTLPWLAGLLAVPIP